jgi:hypothetical protein
MSPATATATAIVALPRSPIIHSLNKHVKAESELVVPQQHWILNSFLQQEALSQLGHHECGIAEVSGQHSDAAPQVE